MGAVIKFKLLAPKDVDAMHKPTYLLSDLTHCIIEASLNTNGFSDFLIQEWTVTPIMAVFYSCFGHI